MDRKALVKYAEVDEVRTQQELIEEYSAMAKNVEREAEEWSDGLIGDASADT